MKIERETNTVWTFTHPELKIFHTFACSDPDREHLFGLILETTAEYGAAAVATDGHRMVAATQKATVPDDRVRIETETLRRLLGLMNKDERIEFEVHTNTVAARVLGTSLGLSWGRKGSKLPWRDVFKTISVSKKPAPRIGINPELLEGLSLLQRLGGGTFVTLLVPESELNPLALRIDIEETTWRVLLMPARMEWQDEEAESA